MTDKETIAAAIRRATARELTKMQDETTGYLHDGWKGDALATWITPGIIRAVKRALTQKKARQKKHSPR
jgi:hypothetical protein